MNSLKKSGSLFLTFFICCGFFWNILNSDAQSNYRFSEDKVIKDGFHIAPVILSTKGYAFGVGYAVPLKPRLMFHGTLGYMVMSYLDQSEINAQGIAIHPSIIFFPDRSPNYKGIILGLEMPVLFYNMKKHNWISRTVTGEENTFVYEEYQRTNAKAFQAGLGAKFGFRTHRKNTTFFWQPTLTVGALYQRLNKYTEQDEFSDFFFDNPFIRQDSNFAPYFKLEVAFGLYRYKKEKVKTLEL